MRTIDSPGSLPPTLPVHLIPGRFMLSRQPFFALSLSLLCLALPGAGWGQVGSPAGPVPPEILQARRAAFLGKLQGATAILSSARQRDLEREYFQDSDYREDNDFFYLVGLEAPDAFLVLNGSVPGEVILYLPPRVTSSEQWTGPRLGPGEEASELTGIHDVRSTEQFPTDLESWLADRDESSDPERPLYLSLGDGQPPGLLDALFAGSRLEARDPGPILAELRLVKDQEELRRLRRAVAITAEGQREVGRMAEPGLVESDLEAALEYAFSVQGAERVGFPSIVGSGPNSVILHYDKNRRTLSEGDLVVVDVGAEFGYYTGDLTRTFPADGRFSPRQRALYDLVLGAWEAALEAVRPGSTIREMNQAAQAYLTDQPGDLCGGASCAPFLIHGVAHWLGMDVHDVGSTRTPFVPGMVVTLEPGLYLADENLGIRIEDDILVTPTGHEVLSAGLPRKAEEVEALMQEDPVWVKNLHRDPRGRTGVL